MVNIFECHGLSKWINGKPWFYLQFIWRWGSALLFIMMMICSILDVGRETPEYDYYYLKWFIYFTNWTVTIAVFQSWLAVGFITKALLDKNYDFDTIEVLKNEKSVLAKIYRIGYTSALIFSPFSSGGYWFFVHDFTNMKIDFVILIGHGLTCLLMAVDALVFGHPIKMDDLPYNVILDLSYAMFTLLYYLAGGLSRKQIHKIYPLGDWKQPQKTCFWIVFSVIVTVVIHSMAYGIYRLRSYLCHKMCRSENSNNKSDIQNNNYITSRSQNGEVVRELRNI